VARDRGIITKAVPMAGTSIKLDERDGLKFALLTTSIKFAGPSAGISIKPRAFGNLSAKKTRLLWAHQLREPIGRVASIAADDSRIICELEILREIQRGDEAIELIRHGAVNDVGLGFRIVNARNEEREGEIVTIVEAAELQEISIASGLMSPFSGTIDTRSAAWTQDELVAALREAGLSEQKAEALCRGGYSAMMGRRPRKAATADHAEIARELRQLAAAIEKARPA